MFSNAYLQHVTLWVEERGRTRKEVPVSVSFSPVQRKSNRRESENILVIGLIKDKKLKGHRVTGTLVLLWRVRDQVTWKGEKKWSDKVMKRLMKM